LTLLANFDGVGELEYHLILAHDMGHLSDPDHKRLDALAVELKRMISSLIVSLRKKTEVRQ